MNEDTTHLSETAAAMAAAPAPVRFLGFNASVYPGDQAMSIWKAQSPYTFVGYYLKSPCHANATWFGTREKLQSAGWGMAVLYVGRQAQGPCSGTLLSATMGRADGVDAAAKCSTEGFASDTVVYLDVEPMDTIPPAMTDYVAGWFQAVAAAHFVPGLYCHAKNAVALEKFVKQDYPVGKPEPRFWVAGGNGFKPDSSLPPDSGVSFATLWRGRINTEESYGGVGIKIDVNVADSRNPSGVYITATKALVAAPAAKPPRSKSLADVNTIVQRHLQELLMDGVVSVRPGLLSPGGNASDQFAIVVKVLDYDSTKPPVSSLPREIEGVPIDVRQATLLEQLQVEAPDVASRLEVKEEFRSPVWGLSYGPLAQQQAMAAAAPKAVKPQIPYTPAAVPLNAIEDAMTVNCHASPDAGWPTLKHFLEGVRQEMTVAMYDFGASYIAQTFESSIEGKKLTMVLDSNPDGPNEHPLRLSLAKSLGTNLQFAWAAEGASPDVTGWIFPNAYHIKVAVLDSNSMWLSSGNWQSSSLPDIDPVNNPSDRANAFKGHNREWSVLVQHPGLAQLFRTYIRHDYTEAAKLQVAGAPAKALLARDAETEFFVERDETQAIPSRRGQAAANIFRARGNQQSACSSSTGADARQLRGASASGD